MAIRGQKFKSYSEEPKMEAVRLHVEEKWTYRQINDRLGIQDKDRMKRSAMGNGCDSIPGCLYYPHALFVVYHNGYN